MAADDLFADGQADRAVVRNLRVAPRQFLAGQYAREGLLHARLRVRPGVFKAYVRPAEAADGDLLALLTFL
ncbi:MAG: hypothetical protein NT117_12675 [Gammaproteobacteria bacterium]|nr:hypothetical protein [Gammaproteobacteria bacterium]